MTDARQSPLVGPDAFPRARAIFESALDWPPSDRATRIREACAGDDTLRREVESLLAQEGRAAGYLSTPAAALTGDMATEGTSFIGRQLGHYSIQARIGAGGMDI